MAVLISLTTLLKYHFFYKQSKTLLLWASCNNSFVFQFIFILLDLQITDVGIQFLAAVCNYLHYLDISGCIYITDKALRCLWKGCTQLRILKMLYCTSITRYDNLQRLNF